MIDCELCGECVEIGVWGNFVIWLDRMWYFEMYDSVDWEVVDVCGIWN